MSPRRTASLLPLLATSLLAGLVGGCGEPPATGSTLSGPLRVLSTTGMIADMAARIAGEHARVESLMGTGIDPHLYKASERDVRRMAEADLILYNGLHLEGKMVDVLEKMARNRPVVSVSDAIPRSRLRAPPEFSGLYDPHIWFDVGLWAQTIAPVVEALSSLAPDHAHEFRHNGDALVHQMQELDRWVETSLAEVPQARRVLVTAHDAFGYFGRRYGVEVVGLQGVSTLAEAGLADVERVVGLVVDRRIKAIFVESSVPRRSIEAVQAAVRDHGHHVAIGGQLYSDSMGPPDTADGTYLGMVQHNVVTIVEALR